MTFILPGFLFTSKQAACEKSGPEGYQVLNSSTSSEGLDFAMGLRDDAGEGKS
jgi:hypothetical protein